MRPAQTQWEVFKKDFLILRNQTNSLKMIPGGRSYKQHEGILDLGQDVKVQSSPAFLFLRVQGLAGYRSLGALHQWQAWPGLTPGHCAPPLGCLTCSLRYYKVTFLTRLKLLISFSGDLKGKNYNICTPLPFSMLLR